MSRTLLIDGDLQMTAAAHVIAILMAGLETPDDLTEREQYEHRSDLLTFLQAEYDKALTEGHSENPTN